MPSFIESILCNLLSDLLFLTFIVVVGVVLLRWRTRRLHAFWGTSIDQPITIYVSHLRVQVSSTGGAIDWQGTLRSFQGSVAPLLEAQCASAISNLFRSQLPGQTLLPDFLSNAFLPSAQATVVASPAKLLQTTTDCVLALGGPSYNSVSHFIMESCASPVRWRNGNSFATPKGTHAQLNRSFIVRLRHQDRFHFWAAGLTEVGTAASACYLRSEWEHLAKSYKAQQFYVVLEFQDSDYPAARIIEHGTF